MSEGPSWCVQVEKLWFVLERGEAQVVSALAFAELAAGAEAPCLSCAWGKQRLRQQVHSSILLQTCFVKVKVSMLD